MFWLPRAVAVASVKHCLIGCVSVVAETIFFRYFLPRVGEIPCKNVSQYFDFHRSINEKKFVSFSFCSSAHKRKPMSKVVYNLLSDRDLKKKLKEHGLSTRGTRQQLIKRHQEFVHMYNAQCDSLNPKSGKLEILGKLLPLQIICMRFSFS